MDDRDRGNLLELVVHAEKAIDYALRGGPEWWMDDETVDAILLRIIQVAEAVSRTSPATLGAIEGVPWPELRGARNRIVHQYSMIDTEIIRDVVSRELPNLIAVTKTAMQRAPEA